MSRSEGSPFGDNNRSYDQLTANQTNLGMDMGDGGDGKKKRKFNLFRIMLACGCFISLALLIAILVIVIIDLNKETNSTNSTATDLSRLEDQIEQLKNSVDTENHHFKSQVNSLRMQLDELQDLKNKLASLGSAQQEELLNEIFYLEKNIISQLKKIKSGKSGRSSPASLDIATFGCPTTFGDRQCNETTFWTLSKTSNNDMRNKSIDLQFPNITSDFKFKVKVTEDDTRKFLSGDIMLFITNSGGQTVQLSSVVLNLEEIASPKGTGDSPGPSGKDWKILLTALANLSPLCINEANICNKKSPFTIQDSGNTTSMILLDPFSNDMISMGNISVPPSANFSAPCNDSILITVRYRFDITQFCEQNPTFLTDLVRFNLLTTFVAGGKRGGTCEVDADCDGSIEDDEEHTRTIQQRSEFQIQQCSPTCKHVELVDPNGPIVVQQTPPSPPECVNISDVINPISTVLTIWGTGNDGFETKECINATVECITANCTAIVSNTALLSGEGCTDFNAIQGSPASASLTVNCGEIESEKPTFCTYTQTVWGNFITECVFHQPEQCINIIIWGIPQPVLGAGVCFGRCYINEVFPSGSITIGRIPFVGLGAIQFTDFPPLAPNIIDFLPQTGNASHFTHNGLLTNPLTTSAGSLAGELLTATLNFNYTLHFQGNAILSLRYTNNCTIVEPYFRGRLLSEVIFVANFVISIQPGLSWNTLILSSPLSALQKENLETAWTTGIGAHTDFNTALNLYNNEFINCQTIATGCFTTL